MKKKCSDVGGQAVIEGVMMKTKNRMSVAVRRPDNSIKLKTQKVGALSEKYKFLGWPFIRGVVSLFEIMYLGMKTLIFSANEQLEDGDEKESLSSWHVALTIFGAFFFALLIFKALPLAITALFSHFNLIGESRIVFNLVDGLVRIIIFVSYVFLISLMPDIRRVFQYHGAEHKSIACYEKGKELTVKNVKKFSTAHRRCGTTFIIIVLVVAIFVFSIVPIDLPFYLLFFVRLPLLLPIASLSYEVLKLGAKYKKNKILNLMVIPGLWLQKVTTREPSDDQLEVAIRSLKAVLRIKN